MSPIDAEPLEEILRLRRAQCNNDYGSLAGAISGCLKLVQVQPTVTQSPNGPLTLEELREMDGEPVYVTGTFTDCRGERPGAWALVDVKQKMCRVHGGGLAIFENCGKHWLAYRRKPEELT